MRRTILLASLTILAAAPAAQAQHAGHEGHAGHPTAQRTDSSFSALQARGARVMGVDQYTSSHRFEMLADGGRIELRRDVEDSAGTATIRAHLREVAARLAKGDFTFSEAVHAKEIPGAAVLRARSAQVRYEFRPLPRGGEVRIITTDPAAVQAVHEFMKFQMREHRTGK